MPNHVQNRVEIIGTAEQVKKVLMFIKGEEGAIDFNSIIPQPCGIENTVSGNNDEAREKGWIWKQRYGYASWYEWRCDKWGTKWNAYEVYQHDNIVEFQTAWSAPHPVIERLAEVFPDVEFTHKWADEDTAYNCGEREYADGDIQSEYRPDGGSKEAYELAFEMRPYLEDYYEFVDGEYRYKDED